MELDAQLLDRYASTRDADAFTQLVRRHAGMVFGVARRVTRNHHDAEEVAQSCFLELARKAGTIHASGGGGSLGIWLHTVATHRAADCNRAGGRRQRHERAAARAEAQQADAAWAEIAPLVDAALDELPEELRLPVVLYHLEGRSQADVAAELGVNQSTVSRRIEAGVAALREKFGKAGVVAPAALVGTLLLSQSAKAAPPALVAALGKMAVVGVGAVGTTAAAAAPTTTVLGKCSVAMVVKITAAILLAAAVPTVGYLALRSPAPPVVVATPAPVGNPPAAYQGWVHMTVSGTFNGQSSRVEGFYNTVDGRAGSIRENGGKKLIDWFDPQPGVHQQYDTAANTISVSDPPNRADRDAHEMQSRISLRMTLAEFTKEAQNAGATVTQTRDGALDRYDYAGTGAESSRRGSLWADPATGLVQKMERQGTRAQKKGDLTVVEYEYGDQQIKDIYDLGAPRGATLVDLRAAGELKSVLERLQRRNAQGMGEGVGVLTETTVGGSGLAGKPGQPSYVAMTLYAQQGEARLWLRYTAPGNDWGKPGATLPASWPVPDLDEAVRFADPLRTQSLLVTDGRTQWKGVAFFDGKFALHESTAGGSSDFSGQTAIVGAFWPASDNLFNGWQRTVELVRRPGEPAMVGIVQKQFQQPGSHEAVSGTETTHWLDTGRNDVPVETVLVSYAPDHQKIYESRTEYLAYAQLPDSRWYPTYWRDTTTGSQGVATGVMEYHLIFDPAKRLDAQWFGDPTRRFDADRPRFVSPAQAPITGRSLAAAVAAAKPRSVAVFSAAYRSAWIWVPWAVALAAFGAVGVIALLRRRRRPVVVPTRPHRYGQHR